MHNFFLSLIFMFKKEILYEDFKNQRNLSKTRRRKRITLLAEQRVKNVFFDGKKKIFQMYYFSLFFILIFIQFGFVRLLGPCFMYTQESNVKIFFIFCRDHKFDCRRQPVKRKFKFGNISEPMTPSKGALDLSVRQ